MKACKRSKERETHTVTIKCSNLKKTTVAEKTDYTSRRNKEKYLLRKGDSKDTNKIQLYKQNRIFQNNESKF